MPDSKYGFDADAYRDKYHDNRFSLPCIHDDDVFVQQPGAALPPCLAEIFVPTSACEGDESSDHDRNDQRVRRILNPSFGLEYEPDECTYLFRSRMCRLFATIREVRKQPMQWIYNQAFAVPKKVLHHVCDDTIGHDMRTVHAFTALAKA